ncbi:C3HC4-type RING zinc finger protein [Medicago truncatula]|uniref:C3HC4-type RING zinc finger protein n=1 Tax=Medicago truncatula TaxID=3880 RepID=Q2HTZ4_MEDTR|nr:Zinc finger, RING-type [Medicago truncatula]AES90433.1 C3HC4-type RING zinc finger protein [Medicago truncatula]
MSGNMSSHEESLKENEETKKEINNLQEQPKYEVGSDQMHSSNNEEVEENGEKDDDGDDGDDDGEEKEEEADDEAEEQDKTEKEEYASIDLSSMYEIECPICFGIIRKTKTIRECLHRFCEECINKCMRFGKNECPVCRTHCPDQLSLRDDPNYDALIALLCPDIDKFEKEELTLLKEEFPQLEVVDCEEEEEEEEEEEYFVEEDFVARSYILALPANPRLYNEEPVVDDDNDVADELVVEEDNSDDDSSNST